MPRRSFTLDGRRYFVRADTEEELTVKMAMRRRDLEEGRVVVGRNMTTQQWFVEFMNTYKKASISPETYDDYMSRWNSKIKPVLGRLRLRDVKQIHCQKVLYLMEGSSKAYLTKVAYTMRQMFYRAKLNKLILDNPADDLEIPYAEDYTRRAITDYEREITLRVAEYHRGGLWILMMLYCGLRPEETAPLQGRHLDLEARTVTVESAVKKKNKRIGKTKSRAGKRTIPISRDLTARLKAQHIGPFEYVFTNTDGHRLSAGNMTRMWNNFKREMNITAGCKLYRNKLVPPLRIADDLVPYCYRHTFGTDLEAAGVSINEAARLMGHSDIRVTSKFYTHESTASFDRVTAQLDAYREQPKRANERAKSSESIEN